jgi:hypothetical protein
VLLRLRAKRKLLIWLQAIAVRLGEDATQAKTFTAEMEAHEQEIGEKLRSVQRQALLANVGMALSQWNGMEDLLVAIASLL